MSIHWGNRDVRVYAAQAWVSLASRFSAEHPEIVDRLATFLDDPAPAVRLQVAQNLQVLSVPAPDRMWEMGRRIVTTETNTHILAAFLNNPVMRLGQAAPERCEALLAIVRERLDGDLRRDSEGRDHIQESLGCRTAQLYVGQGRALTRVWLEEWAAHPDRYLQLLDGFNSSLRRALFERYGSTPDARAYAICDRAQEGLSLVITSAAKIAAEAYIVMTSGAAEVERAAGEVRFAAAEKVIHHGMSQLYFGSGAFANNGRNTAPSLPGAAAMARFLDDYAVLLTLLGNSRQPSTLHYLIQLYEFLIPGNPAKVFEAIHTILLGRGEEEGYHRESLGNSVVVGIIQRYIADYREIFDDQGRRGRLVAILQLFSEVGWPEALKLLYQLPDLLR